MTACRTWVTLHSDRPHVAAPDPPYFDGRFSNGPNWVDRLAEHLSAERPLASELGGANYAWGAAAARDDLNWYCNLEPHYSVPSIPDQVAEFLASGEPQANQLFSLWAGHNDLWRKYDSACATTPDLRRDVDKSVNSLVTQYVTLLDAGVQHLLIPNLSVHERIGPELVPEFNVALAESIAEMRMTYPAVSIYEFDFSAFMDAIVADPPAFGITEPIAPACIDCWGGPGKIIVPNPDEHFFWDRHHITAKGNQLLADAIYHQFFNAELDCDFDSNDVCDVADIDTLFASGNLSQGVPVPPGDVILDINADDVIDLFDVDQWLADAATENGFLSPFLRGDANLDGSVDAADLNALALNWRGSGAAWSEGDFTGEGNVDATDLNSLALNWRSSVRLAAAPSVPEPCGSHLALHFVLTAIAFVRARRNRS